jgi:hypothetical protein
MTAQLRLPIVDELVDSTEHVRPRTRGECADGPRPCPWASCRHNLAVDVVDDLRRHGAPPEVIEHEIPDGRPSCALDVADEGAEDGPAVADMLGVSRQFIHLIVETALTRLAALPITFEMMRAFEHAETHDGLLTDDDEAYSLKFSMATQRAFKRVVLGGKSEGLALLKERKAG